MDMDFEDVQRAKRGRRARSACGRRGRRTALLEEPKARSFERIQTARPEHLDEVV
jgi:hypothetical protein